MLKSVDILVGVSVIMLVVSMSVTLIIQWILQVLQLRGKELLKGLTALLKQLDPKLDQHAEEIARQVLTNRMLSRGKEKLAGVVQREELIKTLLEIAAGAAPSPPAPANAVAPPPQLPAPADAVAPPPQLPIQVLPTATAAEKALVEALTKLGIADPGKTLDAIRLESMKLEDSSPELATHVREAKAVITKAGSQFVARINGWFDPTMDRVSQSFTNQSRYWTGGVALLLALLLQIDTLKIVNRLSIDDSLRASLLGVATTVKQPENSTPANNPVQTNDEKIKGLEADTKANLDLLKNLASDRLLTWPVWPGSSSPWEGLKLFGSNWWHAWDGSHISIFGVLLTAVLLSFGAPFWFNMLGELLKLRPMLASKDDQQRKDRESTNKPKDGQP